VPPSFFGKLGLGKTFQTRAIHFNNFLVLLEFSRILERTFLVRPESQIEGSQAAQQQPTLKRRELATQHAVLEAIDFFDVGACANGYARDRIDRLAAPPRRTGSFRRGSKCWQLELIWTCALLFGIKASIFGYQERFGSSHRIVDHDCHHRK
jgi:hypothetical protein